jgi:hypothetical protein
VVSEPRTPLFVDLTFPELDKMASNNNVHIGKPPHFDGNNYDYWKIRMSMHLRAMGGKIWQIIKDGFVVLKQDEPSASENENILTNDQAMNVSYDALDINEFNRIKNLTIAHEIWTKLMEIHEGTTIVKIAKLYVCKGKFEQFIMKEDESISDMFNWLNEIVNELKGLSLDVLDVDFTHKFLRSLPKKYETIVTMLVRSDLTTTSPTEAMSLAKKVKSESIALKAKASKAIEKEESDDEENGSEGDEELALFVKKFNNFMKKKKGQSRRGQSSRRNAFNDRKCFECGEPGHIAMNCPSKKKKSKEGDDKKKKKFYNKKKDGKVYLVEWDSDASSDDDDDDDDTSSKLNADIAIKEAPSLFSSPHCLMARGDAKVKIITDLNDVDDDDDVDDLNDNGYSYDDLVRMLGEADDYMHKEREKFRTLKELYKNLQVSFEELKISHNNLKENCEKLVEAQNSSHVHEVVVITEDVGVTCDLLDSPTSEPHPTSTHCSKCKISLLNDNIACDESQIIVENEMLVGRVNALTHDLEKSYGGKAKFDFILGSQRCSFNREGLGYVHKKRKNAFVKQKTMFVKECDKVCHKCHMKGHIKKNCPKFKNVSSIRFDHCYVLSHNAKGAHAKFVGTPIVGNKKKAIWVPKTLVTNIQGPKQVWVPKRD